MAHHGSGPLDAVDNAETPEEQKRRKDILREFMGDSMGPTKRFPHGRLTKQDEGEIAFGVAHKFNTVIINFNAPVNWMGMTPVQARQLAVTLMNHADQAELIKSDTRKTSLKAGTNSSLPEDGENDK